MGDGEDSFHVCKYSPFVTVSVPLAGGGGNFSLNFFRTLWEGLMGAIFWTYRRGSWQYDILVLLILSFIFFTPRSWIGDQSVPFVRDVNVDSSHVPRPVGLETALHHIESELLKSRGQAPLAEALREILERKISHPLKLKSFTPVKNTQGVVLGYDVLVELTLD